MSQTQSDNPVTTPETGAEAPTVNAAEPDHNSVHPTQAKSSEKNSNEKEPKKKRARTSNKSQPKGIAALFEKEEIKELFRTYLITICVIEGFIFFVSFLSQIGPETVPFPWKSYFFAAFIIPLTITFLLGIIVISFDHYIFGHQGIADEINSLYQSAAETRSRIHKFHAFLYVIRQVPFLFGLIALVALSGVAYKLDDILAVIGDVGGRTAHYLFIGLAVVFGVAVVIGLIWMLLSYNLRKKTLEYQFQYKKDVIDKTGLVILGEDRVMDGDGRILSFGHLQELSHKAKSNDDDDEILVIEP
ncbi:MAG: hypothetical protein U9Q58_11455 [Pseudomonadota bacterium]|nr:hypothetical protein [Pseudomonadota bacterium]